MEVGKSRESASGANPSVVSAIGIQKQADTSQKLIANPPKRHERNRGFHGLRNVRSCALYAVTRKDGVSTLYSKPAATASFKAIIDAGVMTLTGFYTVAAFGSETFKE